MCRGLGVPSYLESFSLHYLLELGDGVYRIRIGTGEFRYIQGYIISEDYPVHDGFHEGVTFYVHYVWLYTPFLYGLGAGVHVFGGVAVGFRSYEYGDVGLALVVGPSFEFVVVEFGEYAVAGDFLGVLVELCAPAGGDALDICFVTPSLR